MSVQLNIFRGQRSHPLWVVIVMYTLNQVVFKAFDLYYNEQDRIISNNNPVALELSICEKWRSQNQ